jgi:hypothetical protein
LVGALLAGLAVFAISADSAVASARNSTIEDVSRTPFPYDLVAAPKAERSLGSITSDRFFKSVLVRDQFNVQFRAQAFNAFNTPLFAGPNTSFGNAKFRAITAQSHFPRYLQLGLHILY